MSKVAVMCGHGTQTNGKWDCGTTYAGYSEAALMLPITKAAVKYLRASGVTVISDADTNNNKNMIRDVAWANKEKVQLYCSIHCDYSKAPSGVMPLFVSANGKKLATALNNVIKNGMPMKSRGIVKRTDLYELNVTDAPACILETGCISKDLKILRDSPDKYGKLIAQGICNYLGVTFKSSTPVSTPAPVTTAKPATQSHLYRVRKTWADTKSQVGAYKVLDNAKKECDKHAGYSVFDESGKAVYTSKAATPSTTLADKLLKACEDQAVWMKNYTYKWQNNPTIEKSKKYGTCVTYVACVLQRLGYLKSGQYVWINTKSKVEGANSKMTVTYPSGTLKSNKSKLKKGDIVIGGNGKVGAGAGSHIFVLTGKWDGDNPYIYDQDSAGRVKKGKSAQHTWKGSFKMIALIRLKEGTASSSPSTIIDKELAACKAQADCMKNAVYKWESKPTVEKSKKKGTCVTYVACVLQRIGILSSGQYLWHNGKGYGTGKVVGANGKMDVKYMGNKSLKSLKNELKAGDIVLLDDNKSGKAGSGGHIFILNGKWTDKDNPYVWDNECAKKGQKVRAYNGNRKVLARVRLK